MISAETIDKVVRTLVEAARPTKVILFGSYARGDARDDSDIDLLVVEPSVVSKRDEAEGKLLHQRRWRARQAPSVKTGELLLAGASPEKFRAIARAQILPATVRSFPALSEGLLDVRNEKTMVCLDVRK